jgi:hypothetical protein
MFLNRASGLRISGQILSVIIASGFAGASLGGVGSSEAAGLIVPTLPIGAAVLQTQASPAPDKKAKSMKPKKKKQRAIRCGGPGYPDCPVESEAVRVEHLGWPHVLSPALRLFAESTGVSVDFPPKRSGARTCGCCEPADKGLPSRQAKKTGLTSLPARSAVWLTTTSAGDGGGDAGSGGGNRSRSSAAGGRSSGADGGRTDNSHGSAQRLRSGSPHSSSRSPGRSPAQLARTPPRSPT